jgi:hypothetical protein
MESDDVSRVPEALSEIEDPPGKLEPFVEEEEVPGPASCRLEGPSADHGCRLADGGDLAASRLVSDSDPWHPLARGGAAGGVVQARRHGAEALVLGEHLGDSGECVVVGEVGVVVEEEQELSPDVGDTGVAAAWHAEVLRKHDSSDRAR